MTEAPQPAPSSRKASSPSETGIASRAGAPPRTPASESSEQHSDPNDVDEQRGPDKKLRTGKAVRGFFYHVREYQRIKQQERKFAGKIIHGLIDPFDAYIQAARLGIFSKKYSVDGRSPILTDALVKTVLDSNGLTKKGKEARQQSADAAQATDAAHRALLKLAGIQVEGRGQQLREQMGEGERKRATEVLGEVLHAKGNLTSEQRDALAEKYKARGLTRADVDALCNSVTRTMKLGESAHIKFQTSNEFIDNDVLTDQLLYGGLRPDQIRQAKLVMWATHGAAVATAARYAILAATGGQSFWAHVGISALTSGVLRMPTLAAQGTTYTMNEMRGANVRSTNAAEITAPERLLAKATRFMAVDWEKGHYKWQFIRAGIAGGVVGAGFYGAEHLGEVQHGISEIAGSIHPHVPDVHNLTIANAASHVDNATHTVTQNTADYLHAHGAQTVSPDHHTVVADARQFDASVKANADGSADLTLPPGDNAIGIPSGDGSVTMLHFDASTMHSNGDMMTIHVGPNDPNYQALINSSEMHKFFTDDPHGGTMLDGVHNGATTTYVTGHWNGNIFEQHSTVNGSYEMPDHITSTVQQSADTAAAAHTETVSQTMSFTDFAKDHGISNADFQSHVHAWEGAQHGATWAYDVSNHWTDHSMTWDVYARGDQINYFTLHLPNNQVAVVDLSHSSIHPNPDGSYSFTFDANNTTDHFALMDLQGHPMGTLTSQDAFHLWHSTGHMPVVHPRPEDNYSSDFSQATQTNVRGLTEFGHFDKSTDSFIRYGEVQGRGGFGDLQQLHVTQQVQVPGHDLDNDAAMFRTDLGKGLDRWTDAHMPEQVDPLVDNTTLLNTDTWAYLWETNPGIFAVNALPYVLAGVGYGVIRSRYNPPTAGKALMTGALVGLTVTNPIAGGITGASYLAARLAAGRFGGNGGGEASTPKEKIPRGPIPTPQQPFNPRPRPQSTGGGQDQTDEERERLEQERLNGGLSGNGGPRGGANDGSTGGDGSPRPAPRPTTLTEAEARARIGSEPIGIDSPASSLIRDLDHRDLMRNYTTLDPSLFEGNGREQGIHALESTIEIDPRLKDNPDLQRRLAQLRDLPPDTKAEDFARQYRETIDAVSQVIHPRSNVELAQDAERILLDAEHPVNEQEKDRILELLKQTPWGQVLIAKELAKHDPRLANEAMDEDAQLADILESMDEDTRARVATDDEFAAVAQAFFGEANEANIERVHAAYQAANAAYEAAERSRGIIPNIIPPLPPTEPVGETTAEVEEPVPAATTTVLNGTGSSTDRTASSQTAHATNAST